METIETLVIIELSPVMIRNKVSRKGKMIRIVVMTAGQYKLPHQRQSRYEYLVSHGAEIGTLQ